MQVTIKQLAESWASLKKLGEVHAGDGLTIKQAYWLGKLIAGAEPEVQRIDKLRMELFEKYGEPVKDDDGKEIVPRQLKIKEGFERLFVEQVEALLAESIELPGQPFVLTDLSDLLPLSALDLVRLDWLITEG
jgi:hypothetical protein